MPWRRRGGRFVAWARAAAPLSPSPSLSSVSTTTSTVSDLFAPFFRFVFFTLPSR